MNVIIDSVNVCVNVYVFRETLRETLRALVKFKLVKFKEIDRDKSIDNIFDNKISVMYLQM